MQFILKSCRISGIQSMLQMEQYLHHASMNLLYTTDALTGQFLRRKECLAACNVIYCIGISWRNRATSSAGLAVLYPSSYNKEKEVT
jgi:hypothetical protein